MIISETTLGGVFLLELEQREDERGFFARAWARDELEPLGLTTHVEQCNIAYNEHAGTVRGLHFQLPPHEDVKVVRCTAGAVFDVVADLRRDSPTYLRWLGIELNARNRLALYVPAGCAHGYQTLSSGTETFYLHSAAYAPEHQGGVRWDDPALGIEWPPAAQRIISERDRSWPDLAEAPRG